jgi:hypothetical protein
MSRALLVAVLTALIWLWVVVLAAITMFRLATDGAGGLNDIDVLMTWYLGTMAGSWIILWATGLQRLSFPQNNPNEPKSDRLAGIIWRNALLIASFIVVTVLLVWLAQGNWHVLLGT